jgi:hypothetical protein
MAGKLEGNAAPVVPATVTQMTLADHSPSMAVPDSCKHCRAKAAGTWPLFDRAGGHCPQTKRSCAGAATLFAHSRGCLIAIDDLRCRPAMAKGTPT